MNARRTSVEITYNGKVISSEMAKYIKEVKYTDPASGEADSLDISIHDRERMWITSWLPQDGDMLSATIRTFGQGESKQLPCGVFVLDDFEFGGWPVAGTLKGVSVPATSAFRSTERTKNWENVTLQEIGKEIASRAGISLVWDIAESAFQIANVEQSSQTDCDFYMNLLKGYGFSMKVYNQKIVVYDREVYKKKNPVTDLTEKDILSWSWARELHGTYTGGEFTYTDPTTEEEIKVTVGTGPRILKQSGKADSTADAERKIRAAVNNENHSATKITATIAGNASLVASQCVNVADLGRLSGKYYIDKITHSITASGGYTMEMELSLIA